MSDADRIEHPEVDEVVSDASTRGSDASETEEHQDFVTAEFDLVRLVRRGWWIVLVAVAVAVPATYLLSNSRERVYESTTTLVVAPSNVLADGPELLSGLQTLDRRSVLLTFAEIAQSDRLLAATASEHRLNNVGNVSAEAVVLPETNLLVVTVSGPDPELVAALANTLAVNASSYFSDLYPVYAVSVLEEADAPAGPVEPRPGRDAGIALVLAAGVGFLLALAYDRLLERQRRRAAPVAAGGSSMLALVRDRFREWQSRPATLDTQGQPVEDDTEGDADGDPSEPT